MLRALISSRGKHLAAACSKQIIKPAFPFHDQLLKSHPLKTEGPAKVPINDVSKTDSLLLFNIRGLQIGIPRNETAMDPILEPPLNKSIISDDISNIIDQIMPPASQQEKIEAARLLVIRRKKMKKHKRRKLWKRMRFVWAKQRRRREQRKEKTFQAELLATLHEADKFSAEEYVSNKLQMVNNKPIPRFWKGKRLPEFIIRQLMGLDKKINYKHNEFYKA